MSDKNKKNNYKTPTKAKSNNKNVKNTSKNNKNINTKETYNRVSGFLLNIAIIVAFCYAVILTVKILFPMDHYDLIKQYSEINNLDEALVSAVINVESGFDPNALSNKGASGYMQLMEPTANWGIEKLGIEGVSYDDIFDPELNIALGTWYLRTLYNQFGSEDLAIISYNAGSGNVSAWLDENNGDEAETLKNIPFKETKNYYFKVKINEKIYKFLLKYVYN